MSATPLCFNFSEAIFQLAVGQLLVIRRPRAVALTWLGPEDLWVSQGATDSIVARLERWPLQDGVDAYVEPITAGRLVIRRSPVRHRRMQKLVDALVAWASPGNKAGAIFLIGAGLGNQTER